MARHNPNTSQLGKDEIKCQVSIEQVLERYGRNPVSGKKMQCLNPENHTNHDADPSMDTYGDRVFCRSQGCFGDKGADIFELVGRMEGINDFGAQMTQIVQMFKLQGKIPEKAIENIYDYHDQQGALLYQTVRFVPKDFRQRRPDGKDGWVWNLQGIQPVLYHLPQVVEAKRIVIFEGEKDVDAVYQLGLPPDYAATTSPMGAGKWRPEYSEVLKDKMVVLCPDNDEPGQKHGRQIAESLAGVACEVLWLDLPQGKDVSEWRNLTGATSHDLVLLLERAEPFKREAVCDSQLASQEASSESKGQRNFSLTSMSELLNEPDDQTDWLVDQLLPAGGLSVLGGKPKVGKSTTVRNLCLSVARGEPFLGFPTTKGAVIYCAFEEKRGEVKSHFQLLGAVPKDPIYSFIGQAPEDFIEKVRPVLTEIKPVLIILDTLIKVACVKDLNDYSQVMKAIDPFLHLARQSGAHLMLVHHNGKSNRDGGDNLLGSTAIFGCVDTCLIQKRSEKYRTLQSYNRYGTDLEEAVLEWNEDSKGICLGSSKKESDTKRLGEEILNFLQAQEEPVSRELIEESVEGRTGLKRQAIKNLVESKAINRHGKGGKGDPFRYSCFVVPHILREQGDSQIQNGQTLHQQRADSCSQHSDLFVPPPEVKEQESISSSNEVFDLDS